MSSGAPSVTAYLLSPSRFLTALAFLIVMYDVFRSLVWFVEEVKCTGY